MSSYAGIGKRQLTKPEIKLIRSIGMQLARDGLTLRTGAAPGSDQHFAEGALAANGNIRLCLPSRKHEKEWVDGVGAQYGPAVSVEVLKHDDHEAFQSVVDHHPIGDRLEGYTRLLHARNYRIVVGPQRPVSFVVAFPRPGGGGTAQGIRVSAALNLPVVRLDELTENQVWAVLTRFVAEAKL